MFFVVTDLLAGETSFIDNVDDRTLLSRQAEVVNSGEKPPQVEFVFQHRGRAIYLDDDTVYPSDLNLGESIPPGNSFKVGQGQDQGDFNTGGSGDFRGEAIIWRERSVWRLQGDGRESWFLIRTAASAGAVSHRTTVRIPSGAKYTDEQGGSGATDRPTYFYVSYDRKMRLFFGDDDVVVSGPLQDTMERVNYVARDKIVAFLHPGYEIVVVGLPLDSSTEINRWVGWDYARGFYYSELSDFYPGVGSIVVAETSAVSDLFLAGNTKTASNGKVYRLFTGDTDNGSDISIRIWEKPTHLGVPGVLKILRHIEPWFGPQSATTLVTLSVFKGWAELGATAFETYTFQLQATGVDMATPGQIELMATATARYAVDTAFVFQWTFTGQKKINYRGRVAGFQVLPPSESRP